MKSENQNKKHSASLTKTHTKHRFSRSVIRMVIVMCVVFVGLAAVFVVSGQEKANQASTEKLPSEGGYSIFHETMVDMTWPEIEKAAGEGAVVLLAIAVIEEHGPHMGSGIDAYLGYMTCKLVRRDLESRGIRTLIAPPFYWGINRTTHVFPGTFTVRAETMKALLHDIFTSLKSWGFNDVFCLISHGDGYHNVTTLEAVRDSRKNLKMNAFCLMSEMDAMRYRLTGKEPFVVIHKMPPLDLSSQKYMDIHAGAFETGLVAAFFPNLVNMDLARTLKPTKVTRNDVGRWLVDAKSVTPLGYLGDPASFNVAEAKTFWKGFCKMMADAIKSRLDKK